MSDILVTSPFQPFTLPTQFKAVFNGYIYCGTVDAVDPSVSQVQVYLVNEAGDKVPVAQPLRTNAGGYLVYNGQPAKFVTDSNHSLLVMDSLQTQVWYSPDIANVDPEAMLSQMQVPDYPSLRTYSGVMKSVYVTGVIGTAKPEGIAGYFALDQSDITSSDNSGTVIVDAQGRRWKRQFTGSVDVQWFGAKGDGIADDRQPIQAAIDYCHAKNGGTVLFSKPSIYYALKSTNPTKIDSCLVIPAPTNQYDDPISLEGSGPLTHIYTETTGDIHSTIYFAGFSTYKQMKSLSLYGGTPAGVVKADYVLYGADDYHANMTLESVQFYRAKVACMWLATYVTTMTKIQTAYAPIGIKVAGPGDNINAPVTSITMNSCYALNHSQFGYFFGSATYCTFNSCAADHITGYAYHISVARGCAFNGCGTESSDRIIDITTAQGVTINGIMTLSIGNDTTPPSDLINISGGTNVTIAGVHLQNSKAYSKILNVGTSFGNEIVSVLDDCIRLDQCSYVSNFNRQIPINFLISSVTHKDFTYNVASQTELVDLINSTLSYKEIRHNITIKFASGDIPITSAIQLFANRITGCGSITLEGTTATRLVTSGAGQVVFGATPSTLPIIINNMALHSDAISTGQGFVIRAKNFRLSATALITSYNGAVQYGINDGADIFMESGASITTNVFASGEYKFTIAKGTAMPSSGKFPVGAIRYASNPDATRIGWICTTANTSTFVTF